MSTPHKKKSWLAAVLTFLTIGLGHIYIGLPQRGLLLFITSFILSYLAVLTSSYDQPIFSLIFISTTGIALYCYAIIDVLRHTQLIDQHSKRWYNHIIVYLLVYLINSTVFSPILTSTFTNQMGHSYSIFDVSMEPTLKDGDFLLATDYAFGYRENDLKKGDIILFTSPTEADTVFVKRVERVDNEGVFVLGDNLQNSFDSRSFGLVDRKQIKGTARSIYWSWDRQNKRVRWSRIGQVIYSLD